MAHTYGSKKRIQNIPFTSAKVVTSILIAFLNHNQASGIVANRFTMPKTENKKKKKSVYIPTLVESLKIISFIDVMDRDLYLFLLTHGCRPADARALQAGDFNFTAREVMIQRTFSANELHDFTKTGNAYTVPIHAALYEKLKKICLEKMPGEFLFTCKGKPWSKIRVWKIWRGAAIKAGLPHVTNYAGVKHSAASEIANLTGDLLGTSKFLGHHGGTKNTEKYTKRRDIEKLRKLQAKIIIPEILIGG
jgi:integrase